MAEEKENPYKLLIFLGGIKPDASDLWSVWIISLISYLW